MATGLFVRPSQSQLLTIYLNRDQPDHRHRHRHRHRHHHCHNFWFAEINVN